MTAVTSTTEEQIEGLYTDKYEDLVRMYKSRAGENDVEDVIQEGFYRALLYKHSFNPEYISLGNWVGGIINNCLRDMLKEKRDGQMMHDADCEPAVEDRCPSDVELEAKIMKDIAAKEGNTKQILWLYFAMGYKPEEIHQVVGGGQQAVRNAVLKFKSRCQEKYGHLMED